MLIEGGLLKKFSVSVIEAKGLRPTKSRIRKSIFDILASRFFFSNYYFFDLFAGSGAVGIEALNRGFKKAFFFENNKKIYTALKKNLDFLPKSFSYHLYFGDAFINLNKNFPNIEINKVFFIDAPYTFSYEKELFDFMQKVAFKDDVLIIEKDKDWTTFLTEKRINLFKIKKYGKIYLHFAKLAKTEI